MRKDELLDILGGVDDKFYREAMGEEPLEAVSVTVSKKRGSVFRAAAFFILGLGVTAAAGLLIYHSGIISGHGRDLPLVQTETLNPPGITRDDLPFTESTDLKETPKPLAVTQEDIDYCLSYTMDAQNLLNSTSMDKNISEITLDTISHFLIDLNFDGTDEILVIDFNTYCPIYIFEMKDGGPVFNGSIAWDSRFDINKYRFSDIAVYEKGEEKYYYFYLTFEDISSMSAKIAAAIKYDGEMYYIDYLLSYGIIRSESGWREFPFFRRGWDNPFVGTNTLSNADYDQMEYEEFKELWEQYPALPVVNMSEYAKKISDHCDMTYEGVNYEYNNDNWDCLIIDGTVYSLDGKTDWDVYDENGNYLSSAAAMLKFSELEYLDEFGNADIFIGYFYSSSKMYRYGDKILVVSQTYPELLSDDSLGTVSLGSDNSDSGKWPKVPGIDYKQKDYYRVATYSVCEGHWKYPDFDPEKIPDIKGSSSFDDSNDLTDIEKANYSVAYDCYLWARLYSETVGDYRFDLVAQNISTDKETDPNMLYCSNCYVLIFNINNISQRVGVIAVKYNKMPINSDFSEYSVQAYELKDSIVIYFYNCKSIVYNYFYTIKLISDDEEALWPLRGDYSYLYDTDEDMTPIQKSDVQFTADSEANTLYYDNKAYIFDFSNFYSDFDLALPNFTVVTREDRYP